jgi:predicted esterase
MLRRTFTATLECDYLIHEPETISSGTLLVVTLHGFGSNPEVMLELTKGLLGPDHLILALQGPNHFYLSAKPDEVGFGWTTHKRSESSVRLHHEMVSHVLRAAGVEYGIPLDRKLLVGFSQPVGLNYRFAATYPDQVRGVIGICGGLPRNWESGPYVPVSAGLLHIARSEDEFYPAAVTERYAARLRLRAGDVEFHLLDGPHRFPSKAGPIVEKWSERIWPRPVRALRA